MSLNDPQTADRVRALLACLDDELSALLGNDSARLDEVLARKQQLLAELATASGSGGARLPPVILQALSRARRMNQRNALVLAPRSAANRARLRFLQAALGHAPTYAPDGAMNAAGGQAAGRARASA